MSPELTGVLEKLAQDNVFTWKRKRFEPEDIEHATFVFAATNDRNINQFVKASARENQLVSLIDNPDHSDFHIPATVKRGKLSLAISTSGASPLLAKKLKQQLEQLFDDRYDAYIEFLYEARMTILAKVKDPIKKHQLLSTILSDDYLDSNSRWEDFQHLLKKEMIDF
ncbi:NAD(P)-dependent oxidoreductase [Bacillus sp. T3]|uniref:NAD(P)-dependent oxidoreductase n=1 Tax=Bacillus sp. T3 TaxID=467262 RepID=UPI00298267AD|nr:NAD(P)-dependent oxidoreductase [Bacillus sp. T3]